jgi:hypothetical protein
LTNQEQRLPAGLGVISGRGSDVMLAEFIADFEQQSSINHVGSNEEDTGRAEHEELRAYPRVDGDRHQKVMEVRE